MAKKSIVKNYIYHLSYQILAILIPFITTPYLSRVLGAENIGIYSYTLSITTYFILFGSLGVALYGQREIAYCQENIEKRSKAFLEIFWLRFFTLMISMLVFYFTFCSSLEYQIYYKILTLEILASAIDISWYFQGLEEFKKTVMRNMLVKIISVICIFLFVRSEHDLNHYLLIYVLANLLGNLSLWIYLPRVIKRVKFKELNFVKHMKPMMILFIPQIATQIYTVLDKTMIGAIIHDKAEVGYYEQAQKMIKLLLTIATSFGTVMLPRIAATYAEGKHTQIKKYLNHSFQFIMMIAFPLMFGIMSVAYQFVPLFYGEGYDKVAPLICIISPIIVFISLSNIMGTQFLLPTKQQNKYTLSVCIGAIVNLVLNFLFIKNFASIGASIATVIAEFSVTFTQFVLVRKEIRFKEVFQLTYKYLIASILLFVCSILVGSLVTDHFGSIVIQFGVSCSVYFLALVVLKDQFLFELTNGVGKKLTRKKKEIREDE